MKMLNLNTSKKWSDTKSPNKDIPILGTKASTLAALAPLLKTCFIGEQISFTVQQWMRSSETIMNEIYHRFGHSHIIVRSSALCEDSSYASNAGKFQSISHVDASSPMRIQSAIIDVIHSFYKSNASLDNEILIQKQISPVQCAGVVLTCSLDTGAPYYQINIDDKTKTTNGVTSGKCISLRTIFIERHHASDHSNMSDEFIPIIKAVQEIESILHFTKLDIEFAIDSDGLVHIFQVRPIAVNHHHYDLPSIDVRQALIASSVNFLTYQAANPFTVGTQAFFGNMPDWNPAEIIGTRPNPLALSLYRFLITDEIWAKQRADCGYRDIRPHPLMVAFCGQPYVDIRASLNTFIPADISNSTAQKIVHAYLDRLKKNPHLHDKIEFDVAITCWSPSFTQDTEERLLPYNISSCEIDALKNGLINITQDIILKRDSRLSSITKLKERRTSILNSDLSSLKKALALLSDCKEFGTLEFAHAARAAFVASSYLKGAEKAKIITHDEHAAFLRSIDSISNQFENVCPTYCQSDERIEKLLHCYGHLRPGTYDITNHAYWENPNFYFTTDQSKNIQRQHKSNAWQFCDTTLKQITKSIEPLNLQMSTDEFISFLKTSIRLRESVKLEFTRNLSAALDLIQEHGSMQRLSREELSYLEYSDLCHYDLGLLSLEQIKGRIISNKQAHIITQLVILPALIFEQKDFFTFERATTEPNFITKGIIKGKCVHIIDSDQCETSLKGMIVVLTNADPGFDWLFNHPIAGLITQHGGANSHMAIRAAELGLPAAIGVGETLFDQIINAHQIQLDCLNSSIHIVN